MMDNPTWSARSTGADRWADPERLCDQAKHLVPIRAARAVHGSSQMVTDMLKYIERKSGYRHNGSAWIGRVKSSRSGRTIYFKGRALLPTHAQSEERLLQNRSRSIP